MREKPEFPCMKGFRFGGFKLKIPVNETNSDKLIMKLELMVLLHMKKIGIK